MPFPRIAGSLSLALGIALLWFWLFLVTTGGRGDPLDSDWLRYANMNEIGRASKGAHTLGVFGLLALVLGLKLIFSPGEATPKKEDRTKDRLNF